MRAVCTELKGTAEELDGVKFDVIVCASAYHHFESIEAVTRTLAFFLKPGGSLMVSDIIMPTNGEGVFTHSAAHDMVPHKSGFDDADMRKVFDGACLQDMSFEKVTSVNLVMNGGHPVDYFLAKGVKAL